jgi:hypothetical protein
MPTRRSAASSSPALNDYRPFKLPLAIPIGRLLLRSDLLEGQRDGFCHAIYERSSGIANCGSRLCVLEHGNRRSAGASGV